MKKFLFIIFVLLLSSQSFYAQDISFQTGHTHDILKVKFSPDDSKLVSYSWGDSCLCYWDVNNRQLLWKAKTTFIQKANERYNLVDFGWNDDQSLLYTKSENGTYQTWDSKTGKILSVSEIIPNEEAFAPKKEEFSITKDYSKFYLTNNETKEKFTIKNFSRTGSVYDLSNNGKLFAEGGSYGNAVIRITEIENSLKFSELKGGKISLNSPTNLETRMLSEKSQRQAILNEAKANRDKQAVIDTEKYKKQIYITFEHYGEMSDAGEKRMLESDELKESKTKKSRENANAVWLRLHNDSPLPIEIPTQSMYLPNKNCFFEFANGKKFNGLCDNREISIWHGLEDKNGNGIPFGFDFGSSAILLPKTSALFPVPLEVLKDGKKIVFSFTFQKEIDGEKIGDYGTVKELKFGEKDLLK